MASMSLHPAYVPPMPAVARILAQFDRERLAGFIEVAIGLLDVMDPNSDMEANGDELDGDCSEDDFMDFGGLGTGPGCIIGDPDAEHCGREPEDGF